MRISRRGVMRGMIGGAVAWMFGIPLPKPQWGPAPMSIPFATLPVNVYIKGPRYRVMFDRVVTPQPIKFGDDDGKKNIPRRSRRRRSRGVDLLCRIATGTKS
jgi:hypothetical protein